MDTTRYSRLMITLRTWNAPVVDNRRRPRRRASIVAKLAIAMITVALASCSSGSEAADGGFAAGSLSPPSAPAPERSADARPAVARSSGDRAATPQPEWVLVWSDEFDYEGSPDPEKWDYDVGGHGWGNNELQYYTRGENAVVRDGRLLIEARREHHEGMEYTSTRLVSRNKGDWLYGRVEVRARIPEGRGTWPAIWMLPTDWVYGGWPASGEIDIMEHVGYDHGVVHGTVHTDRYNHIKGTERGDAVQLPDVSEAFHTYAIEWYPDRILFFVDGEQYYRFSPFVYVADPSFREWPFDQRFHLLLNIAVGGNWGGAKGIDETIWPVTMEVDFVRVYHDASVGTE